MWMCPFERLPTTGAAVICQTNQIYCIAFIPPYGCDMYVCGRSAGVFVLGSCSRCCFVMCILYGIHYTHSMFIHRTCTKFMLSHVKRLLSLPPCVRRHVLTCVHVSRHDMCRLTCSHIVCPFVALSASLLSHTVLALARACTLGCLE